MARSNSLWYVFKIFEAIVVLTIASKIIYFMQSLPAYGLIGGFGRSLSPLSYCWNVSAEVSLLRALSSVEQEAAVRPRNATRPKVRMIFFMVVVVFIRCYFYSFFKLEPHDYRLILKQMYGVFLNKHHDLQGVL